MTGQTDRFSDWCTHSYPGEKVGWSWRANLLREIIGNPFPGMSTKLAEYTKDPAFVLAANPNWLTWNDGTIGHMVQSILEEPCDDCQIIHGERSVYGNFGPDSHWKPCNCKDGYIPRAEPRWADMPILADALEEAGCSEAAILEHLRGEEKCPWCDAMGLHRGSPPPGMEGQKWCSHCNGSGNRSVTHQKGCWCLELLRGEK